MAAIGKIIDSNPVVGGRTTNQILDTWKDGIFLKAEFNLQMQQNSD